MVNNRRRSLPLNYLLVIALTTAIIWILFYMMNQNALNITVSYKLDPTVMKNPLMGFAPDARNTAQCEQTDLVFILLRWADWEPARGVYDIDALESNYDILRWKEAHKHAVLRFVCDVPSQEDHLDIPEWLYEATGDGTHYDTELGKGYSPNYANQQFLDAHQKAIQNLAEYCNRDGFVAFVELGSLGHWGEWHALDADGRSLMPDSDICEAYIQTYVEHLENALLLTRRNYQSAVEECLGFYNDMTGNLEATAEWLDWMREGGSQATQGKPLEMVSIQDTGRQVPVGGEFASDIPMEEIMGEDIGEVLASITSAKMTFLGPNLPDLTDEENAVARDSILRRMGYRITPTELRARYSFSKKSLEIRLTMKNAGDAGFYFDWPVMLYVYDADKQPVYWETLALDLRNLNTHDELTVETTVPSIDEIKDEFYIGIAITDYSGKNNVHLAFDMGDDPLYIGNTQIIYHHMS